MFLFCDVIDHRDLKVLKEIRDKGDFLEKGDPKVTVDLVDCKACREHL